jgi:hypothetical protein
MLSNLISSFHTRFTHLKRRDFVAFVFVFFAYFLSAKFGLYVFYTFETSPALIWPPVGIALIAVILGGYRLWLPIFCAQFLAVVTRSPAAYQIVFIFAAANALQAVVSLYVLRRYKFEPALHKLRNTLILISVALIVTLIEPIIATVAQATLYSLSVSPLVNLGRAWGAGIFSVLVITPFILTWYKRDRLLYVKREKIEIVAALLFLTLTNYFLFWTAYPKYFGISVIFFLPAVLAWFALRFPIRWLTLAILLTSIFG